MRQLTYGADEYVAQWVEHRIPHVRFGRAAFVAIGVLYDNKATAGVIYHNYLPAYGNIEMSIAADSPKWASRRIITELLRYPFVQLGCQRVTACVAASNKQSLRLNLGLGFEIEGYVRRGFGDEDLIVMGLLREEAEKWIKERK